MLSAQPDDRVPAGATETALRIAQLVHLYAEHHYRALLVDESTFSSVTLEEVLGTGALPASTVAALHDRYVTRD